MLDGIECDAAELCRRRIAKITGCITMRRLVHRDRKHHGNRIDRNGLNQLGKVHMPKIKSKPVRRLTGALGHDRLWQGHHHHQVRRHKNAIRIENRIEIPAPQMGRLGEQRTHAAG